MACHRSSENSTTSDATSGLLQSVAPKPSLDESYRITPKTNQKRRRQPRPRASTSTRASIRTKKAGSISVATLDPHTPSHRVPLLYCRHNHDAPKTRFNMSVEMFRAEKIQNWFLPHQFWAGASFHCHQLEMGFDRCVSTDETEFRVSLMGKIRLSSLLFITIVAHTSCSLSEQRTPSDAF